MYLTVHVFIPLCLRFIGVNSWQLEENNRLVSKIKKLFNVTRISLEHLTWDILENFFHLFAQHMCSILSYTIIISHKTQIKWTVVVTQREKKKDGGESNDSVVMIAKGVFVCQKRTQMAYHARTLVDVLMDVHVILDKCCFEINCKLWKKVSVRCWDWIVERRKNTRRWIEKETVPFEHTLR